MVINGYWAGQSSIDRLIEDQTITPTNFGHILSVERIQKYFMAIISNSNGFPCCAFSLVIPQAKRTTVL